MPCNLEVVAEPPATRRTCTAAAKPFTVARRLQPGGAGKPAARAVLVVPESYSWRELIIREKASV